MTTFGSLEAVVAAIQEDAKAEVERIEHDLADAIARDRAEDAARPVAVDDGDARIAAARRQARDRAAWEDWADHEASLQGREEWMRLVRAAGERRLAALDASARRTDLLAFAIEAIAFLPKEPLRVLIANGDAPLAESLLNELRAAAPDATITGVDVADDPHSGCIVETVDGRMRYENSYQARAERFESIWRAALGGIYERASQPVLAGRGTGSGR